MQAPKGSDNTSRTYAAYLPLVAACLPAPKGIKNFLRRHIGVPPQPLYFRRVLRSVRLCAFPAKLSEILICLNASSEYA